jgi:hypothetical protein
MTTAEASFFFFVSLSSRSLRIFPMSTSEEEGANRRPPRLIIRDRLPCPLNIAQLFRGVVFPSWGSKGQCKYTMKKEKETVLFTMRQRMGSFFNAEYENIHLNSSSSFFSSSSLPSSRGLSGGQEGKSKCKLQIAMQWMRRRKVIVGNEDFIYFSCDPLFLLHLPPQQSDRFSWE